MRRTTVPVLVGVLALASCGGGSDDSPASSTRSEDVVILTSLNIAPAEQAEPIAIGEILQGSTLGGSPFCVGGTIRDSHASADPEVLLIARTITCPDGEIRMELSPELSQSLTQTGSWTIVGATGDFDGLSGSGEMEVTNDPDPAAPASETLTGTVTR